MSAKDQLLPATKEKVFNNIVKCYEDKEYKRGIKIADGLLKEYPENARTLCMKSLLVYLTTKDKVKGEADIKLALRKDMKNSVCWQTLGLFYRHCKNYAEARKAFQFAYMYDSNNTQLLIDLVSLHIQNRDYSGFRSCNQKLIVKVPNRSGFWLGFMVGYFLEGKYDNCIEVIEEYRKTLEPTPTILRQQLVYLESECLKAQGKTEKAITTLQSNMKDILNEDAGKEMIAVLYGEIGKVEESRALWEELLKRNSENYRYYRGLECCQLRDFSQYHTLTHLSLPSHHSLSVKQHAELKEMYLKLQAQYPRSKAIQYILLNLLANKNHMECEENQAQAQEVMKEEMKEFECMCEKMVKESVRKGIPSFFKSVKPLMISHPEKVGVNEKESRHCCGCCGSMVTMIKYYFDKLIHLFCAIIVYERKMLVWAYEFSLTY